MLLSREGLKTLPRVRCGGFAAVKTADEVHVSRLGAGAWVDTSWVSENVTAVGPSIRRSQGAPLLFVGCCVVALARGDQ